MKKTTDEFEAMCSSCGAELTAHHGPDTDTPQRIYVAPCRECLRVAKLDGRAGGLDEARTGKWVGSC